jgi:hypothetical protein
MRDTCVPREDEGASNTAVVEYFGGGRGGGAVNNERSTRYEVRRSELRDGT